MGIGHIGRIGLIHQRSVVRVISAALQTEQHVEGDGIANLHSQRGSLLAHLVQLVQGIVHTIDRNGNALDITHQVHASIGRCLCNWDNNNHPVPHGHLLQRQAPTKSAAGNTAHRSAGIPFSGSTFSTSIT